ncbi:MAG TPA: tRNA lysidine(34) synthetase TilS [Solirubrobacteraceae bacterium]|jgi:tRNA(Ile)-lysidine synthase|nr:tRNA lysidine(34) synthetase TilS [Solirubrobacteraceae bacterium]
MSAAPPPPPGEPGEVGAEEVLERVRASGLLPRGGPLVAMLSGGRDSVCLLDVVAGICGAHNVHALHVNYGLRPEADAEERYCSELCERLGVAIEVVRAEQPAATGNLQAWARELRYGEAARLARGLDARERSGDASEQPGDSLVRRGLADTVVATGHTATDQVETILYRLAASPGRRALLGMSPREGQVVRPLLELTREQTADYCRARALDWREDPSNDSERYARARVRHRLLPALDAVHPAARENVLRTARLLREEAAVLDELVNAELGEEPSSIAIERLRELPPALARLVVVRLAERTAGTYVPQAGARVAEILALADRGGRAELHVGALVGAVIEDGRVRMTALPPH